MVWGVLGGGFGFFKGNLNLFKERKPCQIDKMGVFKESLVKAQILFPVVQNLPLPSFAQYFAKVKAHSAPIKSEIQVLIPKLDIYILIIARS